MIKFSHYTKIMEERNEDYFQEEDYIFEEDLNEAKLSPEEKAAKKTEREAAKAAKAKEKAEKGNQSEADKLGKYHEIHTGGLMNLTSTHPEILKANSEEELRHVYNTHIAGGKFEDSLPNHYRDENQKSPRQVFEETGKGLSEEEKYNRFKDAFDHVKHLHKHLIDQGFTNHPDHPNSNIAHIKPGSAVWTSQAGDIGKHIGRESNPETDDADIMFHARHTTKGDGQHIPVGTSLKIGSSKDPTLRNKTPNSITSGFKGIDEHLAQSNADSNESFESHKKRMHAIGLADKDDNGNYTFREQHKNLFKDSIGHGRFGAKAAVIGAKQPIDPHKLKNIGEPAFASNQADLYHQANLLHGTYNKVLDRDDATEQMNDHVRMLAGKRPDYHPIRAQMKLNKTTGRAEGHHIENHIDTVESLVGGAHRYSTIVSGQSVHLTAHDKDGNPLFTVKTNIKKSSSPTSNNVTTSSMTIHPHGRKVAFGTELPKPKAEKTKTTKPKAEKTKTTKPKAEKTKKSTDDDNVYYQN